MNWYKQFKPKACSIGLKATSKEEAIREVILNLVKAGLLDDSLQEAATTALLEREELASTGVGMNVAIPHVKLAGIDKAVCTLSIHKEGLEWAAVDGEPVFIVFTVLRPMEATDEYDPDQHIEMMRWIAKLARESDFRSFVRQAGKKSELIDLLKEMSAV